MRIPEGSELAHRCSLLQLAPAKWTVAALLADLNDRMCLKQCWAFWRLYPAMTYLIPFASLGAQSELKAALATSQMAVKEGPCAQCCS